MNNEVTFWQVGSGQKGRRSYSKECLDYGMAFAGERYYENRIENVKQGDYVVLRYGLNEIVAVGRVIEHNGEVSGLATESNHAWLRDFDGWDLPAYCYVNWHKPDRHVNSYKPLPQSAFSKLVHEDYTSQARQIFDESSDCTSDYDGPAPTREVNDEDLRKFLSRSLSEKPEEAFSIVQGIRKLAKTYYDAGYSCWDEIKEHEIRTFLIIPLLQAIGWRNEQIKIEIAPKLLGANIPGSIDIVCFSVNYQPGKDDNGSRCQFIIESKKFSSGLSDEAVEQAKRYARSLPNCNLIFVSNGYCYKAFARDSDGDFPNRATAYLNLLKPTTQYPLDPSIGGALSLLELLLPARNK